MDNSKKIENKKVSIVLPCHNESLWIEDCINSLINQTYNNNEIIIIDDKSEDDSFEIAKKLQKKFGKEKIKIHRFEKNKGEGATRNMGVKISKGYYIIQTDMDAIFPENFIKKSIDYIDQSKSDCLSLGELRVHPKRTGILANYWRAKRRASFLLRKNKQKEEVVSTYFFPKKIWEAVNGYREDVPHSADFDFGMRVKKNGFKNLWAEDVYFEHADPTNWKKFFMRLFNGARYDAPVKKAWGRWLTPKQKIKEIIQSITTILLITIGFMGFYLPIFFTSWVTLFILLGITPIFIHKETKVITKICLQKNYTKTLFLLPIINILRIVASNFGKIFSIVFYKRSKNAITFDV